MTAQDNAGFGRASATGVEINCVNAPVTQVFATALAYSFYRCNLLAYSTQKGYAVGLRRVSSIESGDNGESRHDQQENGKGTFRRYPEGV